MNETAEREILAEVAEIRARLAELEKTLNVVKSHEAARLRQRSYLLPQVAAAIGDAPLDVFDRKTCGEVAGMFRLPREKAYLNAIGLFVRQRGCVVTKSHGRKVIRAPNAPW